jgi:hypothetical protein
MSLLSLAIACAPEGEAPPWSPDDEATAPRDAADPLGPFSMEVGYAFPPRPSAFVVTDGTATDLSFWMLCDDAGTCLIDGLFSLEPGGAYSTAVDAGWYQAVVAGAGACAWSEWALLGPGDTYIWNVTELPETWSGGWCTGP